MQTELAVLLVNLLKLLDNQHEQETSLITGLPQVMFNYFV